MPPYAETAMDIAREAGALLSDYFSRNIGFQLKGENDLVTEADRASEKLVVDRLRSAFPTHRIVGEEGGEYEGSAEYTWYVDPLDGTTNFAHGFPVYNVTLGLEQNGRMIAGAIFDPTRDEMFAAERGSGAWLNGLPIRVSDATRLEDALVATGFPSRKRHQNINIHFYYQMGLQTHGVRRAGSAAIDLAYVACGRLEAFWEFGLNAWDMAAGILLVEEAGGSVTDMRGNPGNVRVSDLLVDNGRIHEETLALFGEIFRGEIRYPMIALPR